MDTEERIKTIKEIEKETPLPEIFQQICELNQILRRKNLLVVSGGKKEMEEYRKIRQEIINLFEMYGF
jgi:hypothetical protein